jgi:CheY-like chemotaxis protein
MKNEELRPAHILLVEDNEGDIMLTLDAFEEYKMKTEVSVARNGKEALDFFIQKRSFYRSEKARSNFIRY